MSRASSPEEPGVAGEGDDVDPGAARGLPRWRIALGAAVALVLLALAAAVAVGVFTSLGRPSEVTLPADVALQNTGVTGSAVPVPPALLVHVLGAVRTPGVYELRAGSRILDAVAAAGGLREDADPAGVNLARPVADGEQIRLPVVGESAAAPGASEAGAHAGSADRSVGAGGRIDLNTATASELDGLPRIGPTLAQRIVDWRDEHGPFVTADDLLAVDGFGEKTVQGLRDLVVP